MMQTFSPVPPRKRIQVFWFVAVPVLVLIAGAYVFFSSRAPAADKEAKGAKRVAPVSVAAARLADVGIYIPALGSVVSLNTVQVKSRVDGQLMEIHFREGQIVRAGDLLATIDPRPFQVQLTQAEGQMARDQELLKNARLDERRYQVLWEQDSISRQQLDTQQALVRQYEAAVKIDQGLIDSARLQLTYCRITAPAGGRVGLRQIDPGNMVHAGDTTPLVVITQIQPISVVFSIPEDSLPQVMQQLKTGSRMQVEAYDREQKVKLALGELLTLDNQIDPTTGTLKLKALFPNEDQALFPNQFVNVRLLVEVRKNALVVPAAAVQSGQQGTFVYAVPDGRTAAIRPIQTGVTQGEDTVIVSGLSPGDMVVVEGAEGLRDGSQVAVQQAGAALPQKPAAGSAP
ncbi:MdtA/MuxA family multidrug efflux RND transporter periplasmic adaptor subunit [Desulfatirhabdium butyrativorans]|uniref:MdtA/MuxA family multidrug efflux RND transporter periplasmic adaptor subunit n=1 Tax=Desulfatirhabdium butyrativorans TaxID=340467 RepID=UPI0003F51B7F|nr:MdtA/MuxA family multidrug efflux RND transporter periplasmic adaptor subunit [Desulfatirhabdium butyrativorans]